LKADKCFVYFKSCEGTAVAIAKWIDSILPKVKADFAVGKSKDIGILVRSNQTGLLVNNSLSAKHRWAHLHPLEENISLWGVIFADLLKFRYDSQQTVQELIDRHNYQLNNAQLTEVRQKIKAVRECPDSKLFDLMESVAKVFRPNAAKDVPIALLRACEVKDLKKSFAPAQPDEIQIMTIHKSKGLEFDIVFHLDLYEWILPGKRPGEGNDFDNPVFPDWEQDRNLHYVGITRARKLCVLCTSTKRVNSNNNEKQGKPSEFLSVNGLEKLRINSRL
jgi:DNA helicase-2/ATP-dependent DNA helicase PcrA